MPPRAAPPRLPSSTFTYIVPMHGTVEVQVSDDPEGVYNGQLPRDGRAVQVVRRETHRPLAGGTSQLVTEPLGAVRIHERSTFFRRPRKTELVVEPTLAPGKDGAAVPCHVTALDHVGDPGAGAWSRTGPPRWRLTCEPVTRPKRRKDVGPWYVFVRLT